MELLLTLHSYWAYITFLVLIIAVANAVRGYFTKSPFILGKDLRISLFALICTHIQLLLGLLLYFFSPRFALWSEMGMGGIMKKAMARLYLVEHPFINIVAVVLITMGWSLHKKQNTDQRKFGKIALFYGLGLLLILSRIPWQSWWSA